MHFTERARLPMPLLVWSCDYLLTSAHRYSDQLTRRTMAVFYGQVKDETFRKQMKENRKIEELILMFATNATNVLKKEPTLDRKSVV